MSPETHLLASWVIAAKATRHPRDCRLVTLAGLLPDADGLGLLIDFSARIFGQSTSLYQQYHHWLLHGLLGAGLVAGIFGLLGVQKLRVALLALAVVHLHLFCDLLGSRGPSIEDLWPIYYFGPFSRSPIWLWEGQWRLDGWQNRYITLGLFAAALWIPLQRGDSVVGIFNRRADAIFVGVLRKWQRNLLSSRGWRLIRAPRWRAVTLCAAVAGFILVQYGLWQPGLNIQDGQFDRRHNALWLSSAWLGTDQIVLHRDPAQVETLKSVLRRHHISDLFPKVPPAEPSGRLPALDAIQTEQFLEHLKGVRVLPCVSGRADSPTSYANVEWRATFISAITNLLMTHTRFAGVHLSLEVPDGDAAFLQLLDSLRAALPKGKLLSVAASPPRTRWQSSATHWEENYYREVSRRSDRIVVVMHNPRLTVSKLNQKQFADWTAEVLSWPQRKPVLFAAPASDADRRADGVENLDHFLLGLHAALSERPYDPNYQGIALPAEWAPNSPEWEHLRKHFLKP
jgi:hypothetical protein